MAVARLAFRLLVARMIPALIRVRRPLALALRRLAPVCRSIIVPIGGSFASLPIGPLALNITRLALAPATSPSICFTLVPTAVCIRSLSRDWMLPPVTSVRLARTICSGAE